MSTNIPYANLNAKGENWPVVQGCSGVDELDVDLKCKPICWARPAVKRFVPKRPPKDDAEAHRFEQRRDFLATFHQKHLTDPFHWREPRRILMNFTGDTFDRAITNEQLRSIFDVVRDCPRHTFLCLTKQAKRMEEWTTTNLPNNPPWDHLWMGVSVMGPDDLWRVDALIRCPSMVKFVSAEPLLSGIDLRDHLGGIDWVVTAGDSSGRYPSDPRWFRDLRDHCAAAGVAFMYKNQTGFPPLDGVVHNEIPRLSP